MKWILLLLLVFSVVLGYVALLADNVRSAEDAIPVYVSSGWSFDDLSTHLKDEKILKYPRLFAAMLGIAGKERVLYPGKYLISGTSSNLDLLRTFLSGKRESVDVTLSGRLRISDVAAYLGNRLEPDSSAFMRFFLDSTGLKQEQVIGFFLADTYAFPWALSPSQVWSRFKKEFDLYWTPHRLELAKAISLNPEQVIILASIVDGEARFAEEMPRIAGVYLNRLKKNWKLDADPTIQYLIREEGRQRILNADRKIDSPYNTYLYKGLPPGPLFMPQKSAIEAVLNAEKHQFMFFCAKDDFSGYHEFSQTLAEHNRYAARYHRALDKAGILR